MTVIEFPTKVQPARDVEPDPEKCIDQPCLGKPPTHKLRQISTETYEIIDEEVMIDEVMSHISRFMDQIGCTDRLFAALEERVRLIRAIRVMEGSEQ